MKTEFLDVSDTRKQLVVEIPSTVVDAEIDRVARDYSKAARIPGFRPGKVPAKVVRQRFRDQILHDVAHDLIPRAVDDALRERGVEPVDTPDIRDVLVEEGRPLKFTANFETVPAFDPGSYSLALRKPVARVEDSAVADTLERLRQRAARYESVEGRPVEAGDFIVADLVREAPDEPADRHEDITVEIGAASNPPGFDDQVVGLSAGSEKRFPVEYPADHSLKELAGKTVYYSVLVKSLKKRVVPALDDEFAKDLGEFATLEELRARVTLDLQAEADRNAERELRQNLLKQLADRITFEIPEPLIDREIERRTEDFVRRLMEQGIDPRQAGVDWQAFRDNQRETARNAVASAIVLDEIARREQLTVEPGEVDAEIEKYAAAMGRTTAAVRARLEKEGRISSLYTSLRREKAVDFLRSRATIVEE
jgi:trigger factor